MKKLFVYLILSLHICQISANPFFWGFALEGFPIDNSKIEQVKDATKITPELLEFYLQWPSKDRVEENVLLTPTLEAIWQQGMLPCMTWEPMYFLEGKQISVPAALLLNG